MRYTTADIASELGISERTVRRWIADLVDYSGGKYSVSAEVAGLLKKRVFADTHRTPSDALRTIGDTEDDGLIAEWFTPEEHERLMPLIYTEYPVMKKQLEMSDENLRVQKDYIKSLESQIEYFRFSYSKQLEIHEKLIETFQQRNFIEAKEKGMDKS